MNYVIQIIQEGYQQHESIIQNEDRKFGILDSPLIDAPYYIKQLLLH